MTTLTDFLLARIEEDEAEANAMLQRYREGGDVSSRRWRRVLAECAAKRRIVDLHTSTDGTTEPTDCRQWALRDEPCPTLRYLALPYADHPDYREEWKP